jgi:hypothetical protein
VTAYTTADQIAAMLGVTFTPGQAAQADALCQAITLFVDRYTGRSWQTVSPVSGERDQVVLAGPGTPYPPVAGVVFLQHTPAVGVTAVGVRTAYPNDQLVPLDPAAYELLDPEHGVLTVAAGYGWCVSLYAEVDYSYADAVPADITLAATMIGAGAMAKLIAVQGASGQVEAHPELAGVKSIAVGQNDVSITLADAGGSLAGAVSESGSAWAQPGSAVAMILDGYRRVVIA